MTGIPHEAREGLLRAWIGILRDRHPDLTWIPVAAAREPQTATADAEEDPLDQAADRAAAPGPAGPAAG
jgi:hypothetical protein